MAQSTKRKVCYFCEKGIEPSYKDSVTLKKFISDRMRIISHLRNENCTRHQRALTREIKRARHLALLPFVTRV